MDAHQREYLAAAEGMQDTYGIVPTPPVIHVVGNRPIPVWNPGATVTWHDAGHHHHGTVVDIRYRGEDREPDQRLYVVRERDPGQPPRWHELTHSQLCEW